MAAPQVLEFLTAGAEARFDRVQQGARCWASPSRSTRGWSAGDYYNHTLFEFPSHAIDAAERHRWRRPLQRPGRGARRARVPVASFAPASSGSFSPATPRGLAGLDAARPGLRHRAVGGHEALSITDELRRAGVSADRSFDQRSMKAQMKAADRSGADVAVIVGPDEVAAGARHCALRDERPQETVARTELIETVRKWLPA